MVSTIGNIPFSFLRITVYNIIIYYMSGLSWSAGDFFTYEIFIKPFHLLYVEINMANTSFPVQIYVAYLTVQGLFWTRGCLFVNFNASFRFSVVRLPNTIQYFGYTIPVSQMKRWLFCIVSIAARIRTVYLPDDSTCSFISIRCLVVRRLIR